MKKDNSTFRKKVTLRFRMLMELREPSVVETHGGMGKIFGRCYAHLSRGVVIEKKADRAAHLAEQRPTWSVYEADCEAALAAGVGFHLRPNFFDLDPYGECWPIVDAIFSGMPASDRPPKLVLVVNDGLRKKLQLQGGWVVKSLREIVEARGNASLYEDYLDVCREMVTQKASAAGYSLAKWTAYYCGAMQSMTHFAAVLELGTRG